jgi:hypothetical protein
MKPKSPWIPQSAARSFLAGLLCCLPTGAVHAQLLFGAFGTASSATFQGQASAVAGFVMGSGVSLASTGPLSLTGGAQEASALEASLAGGLSVGVSHAAIVGGGTVAESEASVANVSFTGCAGLPFTATTIAADFVMSRVSADCPNGAAVSAMVEVTGLVINGQAIAVTGQANQFVFLSSGGFVIINEQVAGAAGITVNALHLIVPCAGVDVVVASSSAAITCPSTPPPAGSSPPPCHFVTGGGWITGTPSHAKANFGVAGGIKNGEFWGHLNYKDHGNGMHVKATAVTGYQVDPIDPDCRIINYAVTIDQQPGTARVRVCDKGEPGRNDIFEIQLSNGYSAGGDLGGSRPGGGNIQLHRCHE